MTELFPKLNDLQSSFASLLLVAGFALILPVVVDPTKTWQRSLLLFISFLVSLRYAWWRVTDTLAPPGLNMDVVASWSLFGLEMAALTSSISTFVMLTRVSNRSAEVDRRLYWWKGRDPKVAILIATYNEDLDVLERTIVGAKWLRYQNKEILVLDDGRRDWLRDYCAEIKVRYLRRPDNRGSKAGNINNAVRVLAADPEPPDFLAVLDADFVPHEGFISRCLALFHDPEVGLVQTPQHFFNADPIQHNLGISRSYPDEQRFFFDHLQPSRDAWGIAFCCGTSSMVRWTALQQVGGFPTESVTEDYLLTLVLRDAGWSTKYLAEPLTEGLAPEGLKEYVTQRARWCLGMMQIARSHYGPFSKGNLRIRDRWSILDAVSYWLTTFPFRIAAVAYPLLYWYCNITVVDASLAEVITYFGCYYFWVMIVLNTLSRGMVVPIINDVSQILGAIPIARAAFVGLVRPKGHPFKVTAKGGDRSKIVVQWRFALPLGILFLLTLFGLIIGIISDRFSFMDAGDGKWVILFWSIYNLIVLFIATVVCVELPRREVHVMDGPEEAKIEIEGQMHGVWLASLAGDAARIRGLSLEQGTQAVIHISGIGGVKAEVVHMTQDGARLLLHPSAEQRSSLLLRFYAEDSLPGVSRPRATALMEDIFRRLSFNRRTS